MNTRKQILAAMLAGPLTMSTARGAKAALPDFTPPPGLFRDAEVPAIEASGPMGAAPQELPSVSCPVPLLDGGQLRGRLLSSTVDVKWANGSPMGTIEPQGTGWVFRGTGGELIATAAESSRERGRTLTVSGCSGESVGTVIESETGYDGARSFALGDASGAEVGRTGSVDYLQSRWTVSGPAGATSIEDDHWFLDSWTVRGRADARLVAFAVVANSAANRRESQRRHRERAGDRPGRDR